MAYFSPIIWDDLKQRPQHLAEELSRYYKIYYIEPSVSLIQSLFKRSKLYKARRSQLNPNLHVLRPSGKYRLPRSLEVLGLEKVNYKSEVKQLQQVIDKCTLIWLGSPLFYNIVKLQKDKYIVYDKMDEHTLLTNNRLLRRLVIKYERELISRADIVFTSSEKLLNDINNYKNEAYLINNGIDRIFLKSAERLIDRDIIKEIDSLRKVGCRIFGYVGTIDHWFDYQAVTIILRSNEMNQVFLVGKNNLRQINEKRIHYCGPVEKKYIPSIIESFDCCLYTFKPSILTATVNPVKIYEYLALNKPVIAIRCSEMDKFEKYISTYATYDELGQLLKNNNLCDKNPFADIEENEQFIVDNSWEQRANSIIKHMKI